MLAELSFDIFISAIAIALSPFPVIAITLVLGSPHARSRGVAFAIGWLAGLGALTTLTYVLLLNLESAAGPSYYQPTNWAQVVFGIILVLIGIKKWLSRPQKKSAPEVPAWVNSVDSLSSGKTVLLGAMLAGINPKNLVFSVLFLTDLIQADLGPSGTAFFIVIFVGMCSLVILGSVAYYLTHTTTSDKWLQKIKLFMITNNDAIMMYMSLIFGVLFILKGMS